MVFTKRKLCFYLILNCCRNSTINVEEEIVNSNDKELNQFPSLGFEHMWQQPTNWKTEVIILFYFYILL